MRSRLHRFPPPLLDRYPCCADTWSRQLIERSYGPRLEPTFRLSYGQKGLWNATGTPLPKWIPHVVCKMSLTCSTTGNKVCCSILYAGLLKPSVLRLERLQLPKDSAKGETLNLKPAKKKKEKKEGSNTLKMLTLNALPSSFLGFLPFLFPAVHQPCQAKGGNTHLALPLTYLSIRAVETCGANLKSESGGKALLN